MSVTPETIQVTQYHIYADSFETSEVPKGMTIEQYAEQRYGDGEGMLDDHTLEIHYPIVSTDKFTMTASSGGPLDPKCDECSDLLDEEDVVRCHDGKIRCLTCCEAMYRENGGAL
jgi:hypothetical protein